MKTIGFEKIFLVLLVILCGPHCFATQLTESERRGKDIYLRGASSSGHEIVGRVGEVDVPGSTVSCSGCHGVRGEGKTEAGVTAGALTWSNLVKPYGHEHPSGRKHGPFNESSFIRAVVNGIDSSGNNLLVAMPRYKLSPQDVSDLIAYLKRIDTDFDPGLTESNVVIGLMVPSKGALADVGAAIKDVFTAYFDDVNSRGGIFNRKIDLRFVDVGAGGADTTSLVQTFARQEQIFAFVGGLSAGADNQLAALARNEQIPFIGPSTLLPHAETPVNRYLFYLLPGVDDQAISLVNFAAAQRELLNGQIAIVHSDTTVGIAAATAAAEQAKKIGRSVGLKLSYSPENFDPKAIVNELKNKDTQSVFFFGSGKEEAALVQEAAAASWTPNLFLLGVMTGKDLVATSTTAFRNKIFIAFPTVPSDITNEGGTAFRSLHEKYKFLPRHTVSQLAAFAAAKVFVEALTRTGKDLSREKLVTSLEGLYEFDTGFTPRITFGPNRRVGAAGAHVVAVDVAEKEFATASGWIKAY
jgi:ABC-type branched-subunit amino acid transport system substrate-binding protein